MKSDKIIKISYKDSKVKTENAKKAVDILNAVLDKEKQYQDALGWFDIDLWANDRLLDEYNKLANSIEADCFVVIGVGGSNQASRAIIEALKDKGPDILWVGNNISGNYIDKILKQLDNYKQIYINVIAKNFETLEPGLSFRIIRQYLQNRYKDWNERIIVTGTKNSHLNDLADQYDFRFLPFPDDIGGRFTSLSAVGLFPMAMAKIDIHRLIQGAKVIEQQLKEDRTINNIALQYALTRYLLSKSGYNIEALAIFEDRLYRFGRWWVQLFGESEGKENKGLFPVVVNYSEDLHSIGQYMQEGKRIVFETFINIINTDSGPLIKSDVVDDRFDYLNDRTVASINNEAYKATYNAHNKIMPCINIDVDYLDEYYFGQLFYFFEFACYLSCRLNEVNPFDQQGVEEYKKMMFEYLGK